MICLRKTDKSVFPLPKDVAFIELINPDGEIACVLQLDPTSENHFTIFDGDSEKGKRYSHFFKVKFVSKSVNLNQVESKKF